MLRAFLIALVFVDCLVQAFVNTMKLVFPGVYTFNIPNTFNMEIMTTEVGLDLP
jgi:hypothetical protein